MFHLVVTRAFGQYRAGDRITDPKAIDAVRKDCASNVVSVIATEAPIEPAPSPKPRKSQ